MDFPKNKSSVEVNQWLSDRPSAWKKIVYARSALRALPTMAKTSEDWLRFHAVSLFRANLIAWTALSDSDLALRNSAELSRAALQQAQRRAYNDGIATTAIFGAMGAVFLVIGESAEHLFEWEDIPKNRSRHYEGILVDLMHYVEKDCKWLVIEKYSKAENLIWIDLWMHQIPEERWHDRRLLKDNLLKADPNYTVWIDWYERRIRGEHAAFDIPGDKRRVEDKKILRRLAEATDEEFWGKGHEYVNATLKGWLDEARVRVALPKADEDVKDIRTFSGVISGGGAVHAVLERVPPIVPLQNRNAISFLKDDTGRIAIDTTALANDLRADAGAQDRHAEAVREARHALNRCQGNNAAARLTAFLSNYLEAAGESVEAVKPSLLVQRGERLRQELARYEAPDHMLPPVADDLLLDLKGWQSAHNMVVGLDPVLNAMDTAMLGPDRRPSLITPDEIKRFVNDAREADLLAEGVEDILIETADLAPIVPDPTDRRTNASIEMARNLCIETMSIVLNYPMQSFAGSAAVAVILSPILISGIGAPISILGAIKAAEYLVAHRQWIEDKMGNTPTWQALFLKIADWLETNTPFKPK